MFTFWQYIVQCVERAYNFTTEQDCYKIEQDYNIQPPKYKTIR